MKSTNFARDLKNWFSVCCVSKQDHKGAKLQGHPHSVSGENLDAKKKKKGIKRYSGWRRLDYKILTACARSFHSKKGSYG